jgi:tetratricopeptide (TPR) repeat protein
MKTYNRDLKRARRWLAAGRSSKVIHYLEPKVPLFIEDPLYYALLGRACLEGGLLRDADTYLNRGLQADPGHLDVRLTLAANHLKRKDPAAAVRTWLEVLEDFPKDKCARRGLKSLKRISDPFQQDRFLEKFDARRYMPFIGSRWPGLILLFLLVILIGLMGFYFRDTIVSAVSERGGREYRPGTETLIPEAGRPLTVSGGDVLYPMNDSEVSRTLKRALKLYQNYQDNEARFELNKIRYSNASDDIRQQAIGLLAALGNPTIENIETDYSFEELSRTPWLYENCWVLWSGMTANVVFDEDAIRFDFLVGFEDGQVLKGKVPVELPFLVVMEPLPLELLARVEPRNGSFVLIGKTVHFIR